VAKIHRTTICIELWPSSWSFICLCKYFWEHSNPRFPAQHALWTTEQNSTYWTYHLKGNYDCFRGKKNDMLKERQNEKWEITKVENEEELKKD
jgi:hypothetical protein